MKTQNLLVIAALLVGCGKDEGKGGVEGDCVTPGNICTFAGMPLLQMFGPEGQLATESPLNLPQDITFAEDGTAYIPDFNNHRIRRIDTDGVMNTITGTGFLGDGPEGDAMIAAWNHPTNIAIDPNNPAILHVAAWHNSRINKVDTVAGTMTWEAGTGARQFAGEGTPAIEAILDLPSSVDFDDVGNLYVSDQANQLIRRITPDGNIETVAGQTRVPGYGGDGGPALAATLFAQVGQAADPSNKLDVDGDVLYFADSGNNIVRKIDLTAMTIDLVAGTQWTSAEDGIPADTAAGDGGAATAATLFNPRDVAVGIDGELYIADTDNHCIRVVRDGTIETFAGQCGVAGDAGEFVGEMEPAVDALLRWPFGVATDFAGNVYIADYGNHVIRKVAY